MSDRDDVETVSLPDRDLLRGHWSGLHHGGSGQRRRRHLHLLTGRRAVGLPAALDADSDHSAADRHAGDVLPDGRGHREGPLGSDSRGVRAAHNVLHDGGAAVREPHERHGEFRGDRQLARTVSREPLHHRTAGRGWRLLAGREGDLRPHRKDLPVRLRALCFLYRRGHPD